MEKDIKKTLLHWYSLNQRVLPWRVKYRNNLPNPYYIFISEYMLQQTSVNTVKSRFSKFISRWPTIDNLSKVKNSTILNFWSGLGYYSRATNLLLAAKKIHLLYSDKIPEKYEDLISLPGVGDYTAKAILGIAYNKPVMPVDTNVQRILARLYGFQSPMIKIKNEIKNKSNAFISKNSSNKLIQAFMDYGSLVCKPKNPDCTNCLIKTKCISYEKNLQNIIPVKVKFKFKKIKKYSRAYIFYNEKKEIMVRKRSAKGMLPLMFEVPNDNWVINKRKLVRDNIVLKIKNKMQFKGLVNYSFSHFDLETEVFFLKVNKKKFSNQRWIKKSKLNKSGLPTVMKKIVELAL
tara:strand:- start:58 stop:1098 length:1041 start_codon:yes stop_codon:yes gene_type:complete